MHETGESRRVIDRIRAARPEQAGRTSAEETKAVESRTGAATIAERAAPSELRVWAALVTVYIVWGSTYLAIRFAVETLPPFLMAGVRFVIAGAALYAYARLRGAPRPRPRQWGAAVAVGGLLLLGGNGGVVWAEQFVASGFAALIVATVPLWLVGMEALSVRRLPSRRVLLGLVAGMAGVAWLAGPAGSGDAGLHTGGLVVLLVASFLWSVGSLASRRVDLPTGRGLGTAMQMLAGGSALLLAGVLTGEPAAVDPAAISARSALALLYLIVFGSLVGFSAYIWVLRSASPSRVSTYAFVNPAVAVLLGWLLAGEPLTGRTLGAGALILAAVVLIVLRRPAAAPAEERGAGEASAAPERKERRERKRAPAARAAREAA